MISTFVLSGGNRIRVQTLHPAGSVSIIKTSPGGQSLAEMFIPAELCGVIAQALEQAGRMVETGPCARQNPAALEAAQAFSKGLKAVAE